VADRRQTQRNITWAASRRALRPLALERPFRFIEEAKIETDRPASRARVRHDPADDFSGSDLGPYMTVALALSGGMLDRQFTRPWDRKLIRRDR